MLRLVQSLPVLTPASHGVILLYLILLAYNTVFRYFEELSWLITAAWGGLDMSIPPEFLQPPSDVVDLVDPLIGSGGDTPNGSGGMIPGVAPPFAMTRWVAMTRQVYVNLHPYNHSQTTVHGFLGTHQPAIWMGESAQVVLMPGQGTVTPDFDQRGLVFSHEREVATASYYRVELGQEGPKITAEHSATSRVGHMRFSFHNPSAKPHVIVQATRKSVIRWWEPTDLFDNLGDVHIDASQRNFAGYFVARFDQPFASYGIASGSKTSENVRSRRNASELSAFVRFSSGTRNVSVRVGVSFISVQQARANLVAEIPDGWALERTAYETRTAWAEKLDRLKVEGGNSDRRKTFYTAAYHALQYPYEQHESGHYYSGYDDKVHLGCSYTGYSIWDTYRAAWGWLILLAPEHIPHMITSMLQDYTQSGWLPMWKNIVETNIMVGTHADSLIAEAMAKGNRGFDERLAYEAVLKDATIPPENDNTTQYADCEEVYHYSYIEWTCIDRSLRGWVGNELHTESASRTLDYAYDDYAVSIVADAVDKHDAAAFFRQRSQNYRKIFNHATGFMEARMSNGSWAGESECWTEGDKWAYTFDAVQDIAGLIELKDGNESFVSFLDDHFFGGHNDHTNEPSHHIPNLYALAGAPSKAQQRIRQVSQNEYNSTVSGLSGNEDCGQMSACVNPASGEYVIGAPTTFDMISIDLPGRRGKLTVRAPGATTKPYVRSLKVNGTPWNSVILPHGILVQPGNTTLDFEMSSIPQRWGA